MKIGRASGRGGLLFVAGVFATTVFGGRTAAAQSWWSPGDGAPMEATCQLSPSGNPLMIKTEADGSVWSSTGSLFGSNPVQLGGPGAATSAPSCVSLGNDVAWVFIRGDNFGLWGRSTAPGDYWHFFNFGQTLTSAPSVAGYLAGRLEVFVRGPAPQYETLHMRIDPGTLRVVKQESIGGYATSAPTAVMSSRGMIDVFVRSSDNGVWWASWEDAWGAWSVWDPLGGVILGAPAAASENNNHMVVAAVGTDSRLYYRRFTWPNIWTPWQLDPSVSALQPLDGNALAISRLSGNSYVVHAYTTTPQWTTFGNRSAFSAVMSF